MKVLSKLRQAYVNFYTQPEVIFNFLLPIGLSDPSKGIYGCGAHSDFRMMTLLATDNICKDKDVKPRRWEYVPSIKGSTLHRLLGNGQDRYSVSLMVKHNHVVYLYKFLT
ncbi:putative isopenicillin N synthase [Arabidopsis thaliana]